MSSWPPFWPGAPLFPGGLFHDLGTIAAWLFVAWVILAIVLIVIAWLVDTSDPEY